MSDVSLPDDDDLAEEAVLPSPRSREPLDMLVRIKAEGMRLDQYLHMHFQDFSRSGLQKAIEAGTILVNGKPTKASYKVRRNDALHIELPEPTHDLPVPEDIPLDVLYQDEFRPRGTGPARWSTPCSSTSGSTSAARTGASAPGSSTGSTRTPAGSS